MGKAAQELAAITAASVEVVNEVLKGILELLKEKNDPAAKELLKYQKKGGVLEYVDVKSDIVEDLKKELQKEGITATTFKLFDSEKGEEKEHLIIKDIDHDKFMTVRNRVLVEKGLLQEISFEDMKKTFEGKEITVFNNVEKSVVDSFAEIAKEKGVNICFAREKNTENDLYKIAIPRASERKAMTLMLGTRLESQFDFYEELVKEREEDKALDNEINERLKLKGDTFRDFTLGSLSDYRQSLQIKKDKIILHSFDQHNNQTLEVVEGKEEMIKAIEKFKEKQGPICLIEDKLLKDRTGLTLEDRERLKKLNEIVIPIKKERKKAVGDQMREKTERLRKAIIEACERMQENIESGREEGSFNLNDLEAEASKCLSEILVSEAKEISTPDKIVGPLFDEQQITRGIQEASVEVEEVKREKTLDEKLEEFSVKAGPSVLGEKIDKFFEKAAEKKKEKQKEETEERE